MAKKRSSWKTLNNSISLLCILLIISSAAYSSSSSPEPFSTYQEPFNPFVEQKGLGWMFLAVFIVAVIFYSGMKGVFSFNKYMWPFPPPTPKQTPTPTSATSTPETSTPETSTPETSPTSFEDGLYGREVDL